MEAVLAEAIESGWIEDAFLAQSGSQRTAMWEVRETIPEGEKRRNGSVSTTFLYRFPPFNVFWI